MKNNTKLIMENWRKFLKEGPTDEEDYTGLDNDGLPLETQDLVDEMPGDLPAVDDPDLEDIDFISARKDNDARERIYADEYDYSESEDLADVAVDNSMQYSGEELDSIAHSGDYLGDPNEPYHDDYNPIGYQDDDPDLSDEPSEEGKEWMSSRGYSYKD